MVRPFYRISSHTYIVLLTLLKSTQLSVGARWIVVWLFDEMKWFWLSLLSLRSPFEEDTGRNWICMDYTLGNSTIFYSFFSILLRRIILQTAQANAVVWWWYNFTRRNSKGTKNHENMKIFLRLSIIYSNVYSFSLFIEWLIPGCTAPSALCSRLRRVEWNWIELEMRNCRRITEWVKML